MSDVIQISSSANDRVRRVVALQRTARRRVRAGLMVAEGVRLVGELAKSALSPVDVFVTPDFRSTDPAANDLVETLSERATISEVTLDLMREMTDTVTPQGILAVLPIPYLPAPDHDRFILIPDQVRDPGNLGTMLRTAWAAGVTDVLLPPGTADHTNPKVVRSGMGAHFWLPTRKASWDEIWQRVGRAHVWLPEARQGISYDRVDWRGDVAIVIGGEAEGAGPEARSRATRVHIPMVAGVESLNAATAAAILLFEVARSRRLT